MVTELQALFVKIVHSIEMQQKINFALLYMTWYYVQVTWKEMKIRWRGAGVNLARRIKKAKIYFLRDIWDEEWNMGGKWPHRYLEKRSH